ncbi:hypothetical protein DPMN_182781 [Dreissena polymorpha]|uniref:YqaJ viral recombinase domain-containing protein n=1 Tax=Dreissena polymorpha TaxID=45954 RepID=A0A9D4DH62_DREPO|nr:hypothetical protein DPMN_182781 [Dreissena polymorpha]
MRRTTVYCGTGIINVESAAFGIRYEKKAKEQYKSEIESVHEQFQLRDCGFVVYSSFPLFAASPDGVGSFAYHGEGLVEVECSLKYRDLQIKNIPEIEPTLHLEEDIDT